MTDNELSHIPRPGVLERCEQILQTVADAQVIGVSELARATGLAKSTSHRLARDLVDVGLLERAGDGFRLGYRLFELGNRVMAPRNLRESAMPLMEQVLHATGQTVHLAVLKDCEVSYIERISANHPSKIPSSVAARLPLHCTATGKCFLAFGAADLLEQALRCTEWQRVTQKNITDRATLEAELQGVRNSCLAYEHGEVVNGVSSLAAPIFGLGNTIEAAISVTAFDEDFDLNSAVPLLQEAGEALSNLFGANYPGALAS